MVCTTLEYHVLVTLPLWVMSVTFHLLLPMAVTSLLISLGVCAAAGAQAALPRNEAALVVASAGGDAVFPSADRARLGALPGPPVAATHTAGGAANARFHRAARQQAITARSPILGRAAPRPAGVRGRDSAPAGPAGLAEQVPISAGATTTWRFTTPAGANCSSPRWRKSIPKANN